MDLYIALITSVSDASHKDSYESILGVYSTEELAKIAIDQFYDSIHKCFANFAVSMSKPIFANRIVYVSLNNEKGPKL